MPAWRTLPLCRGCGEISLDGCRQVTPEAVAVFPAHVRAKYSV